MRPFAIALLTATACTANGGRARHARCAGGDDGVFVLSGPDLAAARELDQEGVRSFRDGRYMDAVRYFRAAFRLGGPSSELWNIARSLERVDDAEGAAVAIDEYLARRDLAPKDRADAEREGQALRARPSIVTITTAPAGARVTLDGKDAPGATPVSLEVRPGPHVVALRRPGHVVAIQSFEAGYGRAVLVSLDLARAPK